MDCQPYIDLRSHSSLNGGIKYVLMVIDCFSKFGSKIPLRCKTGSEIRQTFESLFKKVVPKFLWVDRGAEIYDSELECTVRIAQKRYPLLRGGIAPLKLNSGNISLQMARTNGKIFFNPQLKNTMIRDIDQQA